MIPHMDKHDGILLSIAQPGVQDADFPCDTPSVSARQSSFNPLAAWLLRSFRKNDAIISATFDARLVVEPQFDLDEVTQAGVTFRTYINMASTPSDLLPSEEEKSRFILDYFPGAMVSNGTFTFDRTARELKMLDEIDQQSSLDVRMVVHRLSLRMSASFAPLRVTRTYSLASS